MDKIHSGILKKFHTLCALNGLSEEEKRAIVDRYGVESSADIDTHDLINICAALSRQLDGGRGDELDKLRKRAMASIGGYLKLIERESSADIVKSIACRSTGYANFNKIPAERLRNVYNTFRNAQTDIRAGRGIAAGLMTQHFMAGKSASIN